MTAPLADRDPRGPSRRIVDVKWDWEASPQLTIALDCGHVTDPNPIYSYKIGQEFRCYACRKATRS